MNSKLMKAVTMMLVALALIIGATLALAQDKPAAAPEPKKPTYVGSKACKMCHQGEAKGKQWEIWMASKHANAMKALDAAKGEDKNPKCLKCHTTGYGVGGYAEGDTLKVKPEVCGAVGCEGCHGPGSEYKAMAVMKDKKAAVAAGLIIPDEKTCVVCHNAESPTFKGFKYDEMYPKIAHKKPVAEAPKPAEGGK
jgi:hypothetical protein